MLGSLRGHCIPSVNNRKMQGMEETPLMRAVQELGNEEETEAVNPPATAPPAAGSAAGEGVPPPPAIPTAEAQEEVSGDTIVVGQDNEYQDAWMDDAESQGVPGDAEEPEGASSQTLSIASTIVVSEGQHDEIEEEQAQQMAFMDIDDEELEELLNG
jgi:hypothetical protein